MARRLAARIPDLQVPDVWLDAIDRDPDAGVELAATLAEGIRDSGAFDGVHVVSGRRHAPASARLQGLAAQAGRPRRHPHPDLNPTARSRRPPGRRDDNAPRSTTMTTTANLGFPRMGVARELKWAVEAAWRTGAYDELRATAAELRARHWQVQVDRGIERIPVGDFSYYDQMLDVALAVARSPLASAARRSIPTAATTVWPATS